VFCTGLKEMTMFYSTQHAMAFISMPGHLEWLVVLVIVLLIFGRRLPEVARSVGKSLTEFKRGINEAKEETDDVVNDVRQIKDDVANETREASGVKDTNAAH
jgi:sec-independent protein translocase protein TatA